MTVPVKRSIYMAGLLWCTTTCLAQHTLQAGFAVWPGIGSQVNYVDVHAVYTIESAVYSELQPSLGRSRTSLVVSGGVGVSFRPLGVLRVLGQADYGYDVDVGVRFGPSLFFTRRATRADKNKQFRLFLDPFLRLTRPRPSGSIYYVEIGPLRPALRLGLWFRL